jgi:hypothetical protein
MDVDESQIVNSINRADSLPSLFLTHNYFTNDIQMEHYPTLNSIRKNEKDYFMNVLDLASSNMVSSAYLEGNNLEKPKMKKKFLINVYYISDENIVNRAFIIENLKIKLLSKEHFFASINVRKLY